VEYGLITEKHDFDDNLMIADTGATVHMRRNTDGMFDLRREKCVVRYGNGSQSTSTVAGKWAGFIDDNGSRKKVILDDVTVIPGSAYNLFSLTRSLSKGTLQSYVEEMTLSYKGVTIRFNHRIETSNGFLLAAKFESVKQEDDVVCVTVAEGKDLDTSTMITCEGQRNLWD
jgi:hypothetical protein